jgi:hypothetical protein
MLMQEQWQQQLCIILFPLFAKLMQFPLGLGPAAARDVGWIRNEQTQIYTEIRAFSFAFCHVPILVNMVLFKRLLLAWTLTLPVSKGTWGNVMLEQGGQKNPLFTVILIPFE